MQKHIWKEFRRKTYDLSIAHRLLFDELSVEDFHRLDQPIHQSLYLAKLRLVWLRNSHEGNLIVMHRRLDVLQPPGGHLALMQALDDAHEHVRREAPLAQTIAESANAVATVDDVAVRGFYDREQLRDGGVCGGIPRLLPLDQGRVQLVLARFYLLPEFAHFTQQTFGLRVRGRTQFHRAVGMRGLHSVRDWWDERFGKGASNRGECD